MKLHELRAVKGATKAPKRKGRGTATGQGKTAVTGNVSDINPVHDVVQHIYQLGYDCRYSQLEKKPSDRFRTKNVPVIALKSFCE